MRKLQFNPIKPPPNILYHPMKWTLHWSQVLKHRESCSLDICVVDKYSIKRWRHNATVSNMYPLLCRPAIYMPIWARKGADCSTLETGKL